MIGSSSLQVAPLDLEQRVRRVMDGDDRVAGRRRCARPAAPGRAGGSACRPRRRREWRRRASCRSAVRRAPSRRPPPSPAARSPTTATSSPRLRRAARGRPCGRRTVRRKCRHRSRRRAPRIAADVEVEAAEVAARARPPAETEALELRRARLALGVDLAAVEGGALLLVAEDLVGRTDLGESLLRLRLLALVGMVLLGQLAEGRFHFGGAGRLRQPQHFIGVAHDEPRSPRPPRRRRRLCLVNYLGLAATACKCRSEARPGRNVVDRRFFAFARAADALQGLHRRAVLADHPRHEGAAGPPVALERAGDGEEFAVRAGLRVGPGARLVAVLGSQRRAQDRLGEAPVARIIGRRQRRRRRFRLDRAGRLVVDEPRQGESSSRPAPAPTPPRRRRKPPNARRSGAGAKTLRIRRAEGLSSLPARFIRIWSIFTLNALSSSDFTKAEDPFALFRAWFAEAAEKEINDPDAITLATVDSVRPAGRARDAVQAGRRARFRLLHQRRKRQGRRDRRQPEGGDPVSLEVVAPPSPRARIAGEAFRRRVGRLFRLAAAAQPYRRLGEPAVAAARVARQARAGGRRPGGQIRDRRGSAAAPLGRVPADADPDRVLARRPVPPARPHRVHPRRRGRSLAAAAALSLSLGETRDNRQP